MGEDGVLGGRRIRNEVRAFGPIFSTRRILSASSRFRFDGWLSLKHPQADVYNAKRSKIKNQKSKIWNARIDAGAVGSLTGKIFLITDANNGASFEASRVFLSQDSGVVM